MNKAPFNLLIIHTLDACYYHAAGPRYRHFNGLAVNGRHVGKFRALFSLSKRLKRRESRSVSNLAYYYYLALESIFIYAYPHAALIVFSPYNRLILQRCRRDSRIIKGIIRRYKRMYAAHEVVFTGPARSCAIKM